MRVNFEKVSLIPLLTLLPTLVFAQWLETTPCKKCASTAKMQYKQV